MKYNSITGVVGAVFCRGFFWVFLIACLASCKDDELAPRTDTGEFIAFRIREGNPIAVTRAASGNERDSSFTSASESVPLIIGGDTLEMSVTSERNDESFFSEKSQPLMRSTPFGKDGDEKALNSFHVTAFGDKSGKYMDNEAVTVSQESIWRTSKYWPKDEPLSFCAYAYSMPDANSLVLNLNFKKTDGRLEGSFDYFLPKPDEGDETGRNDPAKQPDLIFAMTPDVSYNKEPVDLLFHHALSAVVFKVGSIREIDTKQVTLKSIALANLYGSGKCTMSTKKIESTDGYNGKDDMIFSWTTSGQQNQTYTLDLKDQVPEKGEWFGSNVSVGNIHECTFLMIPQTLGGDSKIVLKFAVGDDEREFSTSLKDIKQLIPDGSEQAKFQPDKRYIFTIGLEGDVDVEVTDKVVESVKSELSIQNTGISNGYIRAAIVGYWADESGNAMEAWDEDNDGDFVTLPGTDWEQGEDGYYYYKKVVPHKEYTSKLFESYTLKEGVAERHPNQKLILDIVAQIVIEDKRGDAGWPTTFGE